MTTTFHRHAYQFEAVQWKGDNLEEVREFVGYRISPATSAQIPVFNPIGTYLAPYFFEDRDPEPTAELWDGQAGKWVPVAVGEWILPNDGEFHTATDEFMNLNFVELTSELEAYIREQERPKSFIEDLTRLLNYHSMEGMSGTPDFILANYLYRCLETFDATVRERAEWRNESVVHPALQIETNPVMTVDLAEGNLGKVKNPQVFVDATDEDGKTVPLVIYTDGKRNEIGTATVKVTPGEARVTGTIVAATPELVKPIPNGQYSIAETEENNG